MPPRSYPKAKEGVVPKQNVNCRHTERLNGGQRHGLEPTPFSGSTKVEPQVLHYQNQELGQTINESQLYSLKVAV